MKPDFSRAVADVLHHEGGYVPASADDPGGETNFGISKRTYPHVDIAGLTKPVAALFYRGDYWEPLRLQALRDHRVAAKILDITVNVGVRAGSKIAQRAANLAGAAITEDGQLGPISRAAIDARPVDTMLTALIVEQARHYERLILRDGAKYGRYERGWMRRAMWLPGGGDNT